MADQSRADLLMKFTDKGGNPVWAECRLDVSEGDTFMKDFDATSTSEEYSPYFEVKSFDFAIAVRPQDKGVGAISKQAASAGGRASAASDEFLRWRSAKEEEYQDIHFPVEFNAFSFSRLLDAASMPFFTACCNSASFKSATLVKRVSVGTAEGNAVRPMAFLRFEFRDVLLTGVNWDDGELVTEKCTFICRAMRVQYKQQDANGSLPRNESSRAVWPHVEKSLLSMIDHQLRGILQDLENA